MENKQWQNPELGMRWWREVSGPRRFMNSLMRQIQDGKCIVTDVSFRDDTFINALEERIGDFNSDIIVEEIDLEDYKTKDEFRDYLRDFNSDWRFTPSDGSFFASMAKGRCLESYIFLIWCDTQSLTWFKQPFLDFCMNCSSNSGQFILLNGEKLLNKGIGERLSGKLTVSLLKDFISSYDSQFFAMRCLDDTRMTNEQKYYTAGLISKIAGSDGQLCEELADERLYKDPKDVIESKMAIDSRIADRVPTSAKIEEVIWEAQMQCALPITEHIRRYLVEKYEKEIQSILPQRDEYGNQIMISQDMELRHLQHYLRSNGRTPFDSTDDTMFKLAYNVRNEISHLNILEADELNNLFAWEKKLG